MIRLEYNLKYVDKSKIREHGFALAVKRDDFFEVIQICNKKKELFAIYPEWCDLVNFSDSNSSFPYPLEILDSKGNFIVLESLRKSFTH